MATILDPVVANPIVNSNLLESVSLASGVNVINHKLGRKQRGYIIVDQDASAEIYRYSPLNELT